MSQKDELPILPFSSASEWEAWLAKEHATSKGIWLKFAKQGTGIPTVTKAEAIEGALCYGWIDGQLDKFDDKHWLTRFTPRKSKSRWSEVNTKTVAELQAQGRIKPAGQKEIDQAKADGRWEAAYASQTTIEVPQDLEEALRENPQAEEFFKELDSRNRYAILYRLHNTRRPDARSARLATYVDMLARGETIYPLRTKSGSKRKPAT